MPTYRALSLRLRRRFLRHRRLLAASLAAAAVVVAVEAATPAEPAASAVVVAARDLAAGTRIEADDVRVAAYAPSLVPDGSASSEETVVGSVLAGPMGAGEPLTDRRVLGESLLAGYPPETVAAPVRVHDADVVALLQVGDRIGVYAATGDLTAAATIVVAAAEVMALPAPPDEGTADGALVVLAVSSTEAAALAEAAATTQLSVVLRGVA